MSVQEKAQKFIHKQSDDIQDWLDLKNSLDENIIQIIEKNSENIQKLQISQQEFYKIFKDQDFMESVLDSQIKVLLERQKTENEGDWTMVGFKRIDQIQRYKQQEKQRKDQRSDSLKKKKIQKMKQKEKKIQTSQNKQYQKQPYVKENIQQEIDYEGESLKIQQLSESQQQKEKYYQKEIFKLEDKLNHINQQINLKNKILQLKDRIQKLEKEKNLLLKQQQEPIYGQIIYIYDEKEKIPCLLTYQHNKIPVLTPVNLTFNLV